jgi:hypothetical protein
MLVLIIYSKSKQKKKRGGGGGVWVNYPVFGWPYPWTEVGDYPFEHGVQELKTTSCMNRKWPELRSARMQLRPPTQEMWKRRAD